MSRAKREIPHYYVCRTIDWSPARDWLAAVNRDKPVEQRILPAALLARAVAQAAVTVPGFNGHFRGGTFVPAPAVHLGFAIARRGGGLVAPALLDAHSRDVNALSRDLSDLVARARTGHLRSLELSEPTITLTSLGEESADCVYPIIFPEQVAIVGAGAPVQRAWVMDGAVVARWVISLTLAADHRVSDGRTGARFLERVSALLSAPGEP
jgi:pyruvate dehydrogenase E2 component (dihydrolipoamide acetyltransferase)